MICSIAIIGAICIQTDWLSGPGVSGPVTNWDKAFNTSDSITYNIQGQISPIADSIDYNAWSKHVIDTSSYITSHSIVPADFDGDGDLDLAGLEEGHELIFYENNNNNFTNVGSYISAGTGSGDWAFMSANDLNNDGLIDVIVPGGEADGGLSWFENLGNFNFIEHIIDPKNPSKNCYFVETGDIDNDGDVDIIASTNNITLGAIKVWDNDGFGNFTIKQQFFSCEGWRLRLDDLDGDSSIDIINGFNDPVVKYEIYTCFNDGTGYFTHDKYLSIPGSGIDGLWSRDFNNDGYQDVLCGAFNNLCDTSFLYWFENDGTGVNYTRHIVHIDSGDLVRAPYGDGACAEDFDMDGKADVASGFSKLAFLKQVNLDSFIPYEIDNYLGNYTHWVMPVQLDKGSCVTSGSVDLLVCYRGAFAWYENQMVKDFAESSYLESSILNSQCSDLVNWKYFGYEACVPFGDALSFQFRTGDSVSEVTSTSWSTPVFASIGEGIRDSIQLTLNQKKLFQYRVNCKGATDASMLYEVWINYECTTAEIAERKPSLLLSFKIQGDEIYYSLPEKAKITISLYNIAGMMVKAIENREQEAGTYKVTISDLNSGIYLVVFSNNDIKTTRKMVLIK